MDILRTRKYLKRGYDNLILQDIACHSVPSPKVWQKYLNEISNGDKIGSIKFRDKKSGWETSTFVIKDAEGKNILTENYNDNIYVKGFTNGLYSRPSCYDCKFSNLNRCSDITLADFWGLSSFYPELYDKKGVSLVLINSPKGQEVLKAIKRDLKIRKVDLEKAIFYNSAITSPTPQNPNKNIFFEKIESGVSISDAVKTLLYVYPPISKVFKFSFSDKIILKFKNKFLNMQMRDNN